MPGSMTSGCSGMRIAKVIPTLEAGTPAKPEFISDDPLASEKWDELVAVLSAQDKLTKNDGDVLAEAAQIWSELRQAKAEMATHGRIGVDVRGNATTSAYYRVWSQLNTKWQDMLDKLGLTPRSRNRVGTVAKKKLNAYERYHQQSSNLSGGREQDSAMG